MRCLQVIAITFNILWTPVSLAAVPDRPEPDLLFLENDVMKIGIDRSMGASITWLSWQAQPENMINIHDPGRLIQQSYYAGAKLDRQADGQHSAWSPWVWNPIQGGGVMSCFNDEGQGVAVFSPVADAHWNFGPHRKFTPKATSIDGPCMHLAPIATVRLGPKSTLEYRYWMVVGNKAEITRQIDLLLKKYPNEKLVLTEATGG